MSFIPKFGAVYVSATEFEKVPKLGLDDKILNRPGNPPRARKEAQDEFKWAAKEELGVRVGVNSRKDGIIIVTDDDGLPGKEPERGGPVISHNDQSWVTSYLDAGEVKYKTGDFQELKIQHK